LAQLLHVATFVPTRDAPKVGMGFAWCNICANTGGVTSWHESCMGSNKCASLKLARVLHRQDPCQHWANHSQHELSSVDKVWEPV